MINVNDWVEAVFRKGAVCQDYMRKWQAAQTKAEKFRVLADTNGGEWLIELDSKGVQLPVESFCNEYKNFINGRHKVEYPQGYTSVFYCNYNGDLVTDSTLVHIVRSVVNVKVPANTFPKIIVSKGSVAIITVEDGARVNVEDYGAIKLEVKGYTEKVLVNKHYGNE